MTLAPACCCSSRKQHPTPRNQSHDKVCMSRPGSTVPCEQANQYDGEGIVMLGGGCIDNNQCGVQSFYRQAIARALELLPQH